jgi:hypothetical protein
MAVTGKMIAELAKKINEAEKCLDAAVKECDSSKKRTAAEIRKLLKNVTEAQKEKRAAYHAAIIAVIKEKGGTVTAGELFDLVCDLVDAMGWPDERCALTRAIVGEEDWQDKSMTLLWVFLTEAEELVVMGTIRHEGDIFMLNEKKDE